MHRITALAAVVAAGAVAASPAAARSIDAPVDRADRFELHTPHPKHRPEGPPRDAHWRPVHPRPPTRPSPTTRPAATGRTRRRASGNRTRSTRPRTTSSTRCRRRA